jgi:hypothetical protein
LSEEEKLEIWKKSVNEMLEAVGEGKIDVGCERAVKMLEENVGLI